MTDVNLEDADDVRHALQAVAGWYGPDRDETGSPHMTVRAVTPVQPTGPRSGRARTVLIAAVVAVIGGWGMLLALDRAGESTDETAATDPASVELPDAVILDRCLNIESRLELARFRTDGRIHRVGGPVQHRPGLHADLVIADTDSHVFCTLGHDAARGWFTVVSYATVSAGRPDLGEVVVRNTVDHGDRIHIGGLRGAKVDTIDVVVGDQAYPATLDGEWWGASIPDLDGTATVPDHDVFWTTGTERIRATGRSLVPDTEWLLCARSDECRQGKLAELSAFAAALDDSGQADKLADGVVTEAEQRAALQAWGRCVADEVGGEVSFHPDGSFGVSETDESSDAAFERCRLQHAAYVLEAADYLDEAAAHQADGSSSD